MQDNIIFAKLTPPEKICSRYKMFRRTFFYNFFHCVPYLADAHKKKHWNVKFQGIMEIGGIF